MSTEENKKVIVSENKLGELYQKIKTDKLPNWVVVDGVKTKDQTVVEVIEELPITVLMVTAGISEIWDNGEGSTEFGSCCKPGCEDHPCQ